MLRWDLIAFSALSVDDLYAALTLRQLVFSVEQKCAYLDCDGKDPKSWHLLGRDEKGRVVAYARLVPPGVSFAEPSIGRVVNHPDVRRTGAGKELMREAIRRAGEVFGVRPLRIGAQLYLRRFYEEFGFVVTSDVYDEDGIPHVEMLLDMTQDRIAPALRRVPFGEHWLGVKETGQGHPVVLLHSGGFSSRQWRRLAESLASTHRVVVPDLLGYGASSVWPQGSPFQMQQDLDALHVLLDSLDAPAHLVGHSYGGLLAMKLALATPNRVRSLAIYEPVAFGILDEKADEEARATIDQVQHVYEAGPTGADEHWLGTFVDWWNGPGAWDSLGAEVKANFRAVGWKVYQEVLSIGADRTNRAIYATITAPTLLLGGERTPKTEKRVLEKLAATLPRATLHMLPGMGHMGPITHAAVVNAEIAAHVRAS